MHSKHCNLPPHSSLHALLTTHTSPTHLVRSRKSFLTRFNQRSAVISCWSLKVDVLPLRHAFCVVALGVLVALEAMAELLMMPSSGRLVFITSSTIFLAMDS